jgi:hypothetical protein
VGKQQNISVVLITSSSIRTFGNMGRLAHPRQQGTFGAPPRLYKTFGIKGDIWHILVNEGHLAFHNTVEMTKLTSLLQNHAFFSLASWSAQESILSTAIQRIS